MARLSDNEQIYRQRYLDLVVNEESRNRFRPAAESSGKSVNFLES